MASRNGPSLCHRIGLTRVARCCPPPQAAAKGIPLERRDGVLKKLVEVRLALCTRCHWRIALANPSQIFTVMMC